MVVDEVFTTKTLAVVSITDRVERSILKFGINSLYT